MIGEPPSLDLHWTTAVITQQIAWHVYEALYTYDRNFAPIPMLAEGHTVSDGGRRYTITLRKGVRFHKRQGDDGGGRGAVAQPLGKISTPGKPLWKNVEAIEAKDASTVVIHLKESSGSLPIFFPEQGLWYSTTVTTSGSMRAARMCKASSPAPTCTSGTSGWTSAKAPQEP